MYIPCTLVGAAATRAYVVYHENRFYNAQNDKTYSVYYIQTENGIYRLPKHISCIMTILIIDVRYIDNTYLPRVSTHSVDDKRTDRPLLICKVHGVAVHFREVTRTVLGTIERSYFSVHTIISIIYHDIFIWTLGTIDVHYPFPCYLWRVHQVL